MGAPLAADAGLFRRMMVGALILILAATMFTAAAPPAEAAGETLVVNGGSHNYLGSTGGDFTVAGSGFAPNAPYSLLQCKNVAGATTDSTICAPFDGGGVTSATGAFTQSAMALRPSTKAWLNTPCAPGECFVRATDKPFYTGAVTGNNRFGNTGEASRCPSGTRMTGIQADSVLAGFGTHIVVSAAPMCSDGSTAAFVGEDSAPGTPDELLSCPTGTRITGISGRAGDLMDALTAHCTPIDAAGVPTGSSTPAGTAAADSPDGGAEVGLQACPTGMTGVGLEGIHSGSPGTLTYIRLMCDAPGGAGFDVRQTISFADPVARTLQDVSLTTTPGAAGAQAGLDTLPIGDIPVESIPFANVAIGAAPLRSIDLQAAPLRSIPLRSIPLRSIPLRSITLSQLPLELPGGWAARLAGTALEGVPLQTVTLADAAEVQPAAGSSHPLDGIDLSEVGIQSSPLRSIGIASIALGSTPLRSIPLRSIDTQNSDPSQQVCPLSNNEPADEAQSLANWQALLQCLGFSGDVLGDTTLMDVDIAGAPLRSIPLRSIPLRSIDVATTPLRSIPLRSIEISATPLRSIPLRSIDVAPAPLRSIPLRSIPLRSIDVAPSPLRSIPLRSIPLRSIVVDCQNTGVNCSDTSEQTLGQLADLGLILPTATLEALGTALNGFTIGDLGGAYGDVTIGDLSDWLDTHSDVAISLADVLVGLLLRTDYPWEELPVADMGLQNVAPTSQVINAVLSYRVTGTPVSGSTTSIKVNLPPGAAYAPGSAVIEGLVGETSWTLPLDDPAKNNGALTFALPDDHAGADITVRFRFRPGVRLVSEQASTTVTITGSPDLVGSATASSYDVVERVRSDNEPGGAPTIEDSNTLVVGHIATPGDIDFYRIPASLVAGKRVSVDLAVPGVDQDVVLYSPAGAEGVIDAAPLRSIPLRSIAVEDQGLTDEGDAVPAETLQDIPLRSIPLRSISANRGGSDEHIDVLANEDDGGYYTIQVSGYNGATSTEPYVLRVRVTAAPGELQCTPRTLPHTVPQSTASSAAAAPAGTNTLLVVNPSRIDATYGAGQGGRVLTALTELAGRADLGVNGHVLRVDDDPAVRSAYTAWDAAQCSPNAANAVVDEIVRLVEQSHVSAGNGNGANIIDNVVLVGADDVLPQARVPDLTRLSNERDYQADVGGNNPLAGAFATEHILSDDPYGDRDPVPWLNRLMYVPDAALGRLVETPDEIVQAVTRFGTWNGTLDPSTATAAPVERKALVTGYDFLADGANAVAGELAKTLGDADVTKMIDEVWGRADLETALLGSDVPHIASVNAHFDHYRSLPAAGNAAHREDDLFTTDHIENDRADGTSPPLLDRRLLFSMGCHSGLNVPDVYVSGIDDDDWAQALGRRGAGAFVGNTGFGYGDTAAVALTELLMTEFAQRLDGSMTVGEAMTYAKQAYASQLGVYGAYDEKVLAESTFYGLPMFRVTGTPGAPVAGPKLPTAPVSDANTGVAASSFALGATALNLQAKTAPDGSTFLTSGNDLPQVTSGRPIIPRTDRDVTADNDVPARGVLLTGLTSQETAVGNAAFARAVVDHSSKEPAVGADVAFPAGFASVNRFRDRSGERSQLVLLPGQFIPDDDPTTTAAGTSRRFTSMSGVVYYSDDSDVTPPLFTATSARANASTVTFEADVTDASGILRVLVLYRDQDGPWKSVDLSPSGGGHWQGDAPVASDQIEYLVQGVDKAGNVASTTNKGFLFAAAADATPPAVTITSPTATTYDLNQALAADFSCSDENLDTCTATLNGVPVAAGAPIDTSQPGSFNVLEVTGTDSFGNTTVDSVTFNIEYIFGGFAAPVASGSRTEVKAGSSVPVRWQLRDANGYVRDPAAIRDIRSVNVGCSVTTAALASLDSTAAISGLKYDLDAEQWQYVWKTEKAWQGKCRQLVVTFSDGQTAATVFTFK